MQVEIPFVRNIINLVCFDFETFYLWLNAICFGLSLLTINLLLCTALQLHPDKNKHPKAEIAFKLVSEVSF